MSDLFDEAKAKFKKDFSGLIAILAKQWVETVGDLRLLVQEGQLRTIGLPIRLCVWIEEELGRITGVCVCVLSVCVCVCA